MKRINRKGFGKIELITMLGLVAVLFAIGSYMALNTGSKNYNGFESIANSFAKNVSYYKDRYSKNNSTVYYLYELIQKGYSGELVNPMEVDEKCDEYNSYIDIKNPNRKKVVLVCGNYVVEGIQSESYKVYEVTEWNEKKQPEDNDSVLAYNYKVGDNIVLDEYLTERDFIEKYFELNNIMLPSVAALENNEEVELLIKVLYRTKTLVKELK